MCWKRIAQEGGEGRENLISVGTGEFPLLCGRAEEWREALELLKGRRVVNQVGRQRMRADSVIFAYLLEFVSLNGLLHLKLEGRLVGFIWVMDN